MTYGESWYAQKLKQLSNPALECESISEEGLPKRMEKVDAVKYYNTKLFMHWVNDYDYDKRLTFTRKKEIVSLFMFGNKDKYKKFKELI